MDTIAMKDSNPNYQKPISFGLLIIIAILCYSVIWVLSWNENKSFASLVALKNDDISEIKVFDNSSSQKSLLLTLNNPSDFETIQYFVNAINNTKQGKSSRDVITSHQLYLVVKFNNSRNAIELLFNLQINCGKTVYIDIVKKPGGVESNITTYMGGATSEVYLYEWLQNLNLINYFGCN